MLRAYLKRWKAEVGVFFDGTSADSTDEELAAIAPRHPVFVLEPRRRRRHRDRHRRTTRRLAPASSPTADGRSRTAPRPVLPERSARVAQVVAAARAVIDRDGLDGLTMQSVAAELRIKAPSLYKHVERQGGTSRSSSSSTRWPRWATRSTRRSAEAPPGGAGPPACSRPTGGWRSPAPTSTASPRRAALPRSRPPSGLEAWAGAPFRLATGDPYRGQALWAFAHGMVVLEIDRRFADATRLDTTWAEGAAAFG